jgi:CubicO group peptidase (beta-lactamase class C family)
MLVETTVGRTASYWDVILQPGRVWREQGDDSGWSRAAFPLMLVNDTDNHAHQGLALFLYKEGEVSELRFQFVQQTAPYLLKQHFIAWGSARLEVVRPGPTELEARRAEFTAEIADRLPAQPWSVLTAQTTPGTLDGFGGPLDPKWVVAAALVRNGTLFYQDVQTPFGTYPYPLEMRFGVRSVMKSIGAPLALLRLAQVYGPFVLALRIGDYVNGLHPKYQRVRFLDAANMASGFGGTGTCKTHPNDPEDGYLEADYDGWYTATSQEEKIAHMAKNLGPYPWEPGTVMRYRDQDFYLLGVAIDRFLKSMRGMQADAWEMLTTEVFAPMGIPHAPVARTREVHGRRGVALFNAGYYPTLDDIAKIALLYQSLGAWRNRQILHRELTEQLVAARCAIVKSGDASIDGQPPADPVNDSPLYKMGFHFTPYVGHVSHKRYYLPTMAGSGANEVILYPNKLVSIRFAKAAELPNGEKPNCAEGPLTSRAVDRLQPFT